MTHLTPTQLRQRAARLDARAANNAKAGLMRPARTLRDQAATLRQLANEATEFHRRAA